MKPALIEIYNTIYMYMFCFTNIFDYVSLSSGGRHCFDPIRQSIWLSVKKFVCATRFIC